MDDEVEEILAEEEPTSIIRQFWLVFEVYGWYFLLGSIFLAFIFNKFKPQLDEYWRRREEYAYSQKYHKDPDIIAERLAAQEAYARKLQEKYSRDAEDYRRRLEEKEERKRQEWLARNEGKGSSGSKLGSKNYKPEYNPLMGDSSRGYRPTKKSGCSGGGCGK